MAMNGATKSQPKLLSPGNFLNSHSMRMTVLGQSICYIILFHSKTLNLFEFVIVTSSMYHMIRYVALK